MAPQHWLSNLSPNGMQEVRLAIELIARRLPTVSVHHWTYRATVWKRLAVGVIAIGKQPGSRL